MLISGEVKVLKMNTAYIDVGKASSALLNAWPLLWKDTVCFKQDSLFTNAMIILAPEVYKI